MSYLSLLALLLFLWPLSSEASLQLWWKLDSSSGTTATDSSGNGRNGTLTNGPTWVTGKRGNGVNCDGSNDHVLASYTAPNSALSVALWIKPAGAQNTVGLFQWGNALSDGDPFILLQRDSSTTVAWYVDQGFRRTETSISDGVWNHLVTKYNGSNNWTFYLNGVQTGTYSGDNTDLAQGTTVYACNGYSFFSNTAVDDVRVYNHELSVEDIRGLYLDGVGRRTQPLRVR